MWGVGSMGRGGTLDGWGCSGRLSPAWCLVLPHEEVSELIEMLSFLTLGHRLSWRLRVSSLAGAFLFFLDGTPGISSS